MNKRVELQSVTSTADGMGGMTQAWATVATVFAAVWPVSAAERIRSASPAMTTTHRIQIRHYAGLSPAWRVKFGTRYFNIVSVIDKDERGVQVDLLCEEAAA